MRGIGAQFPQLPDIESAAGRVELVGAHREFVRTIQILLTGPAHGHHQPEPAQEFGIRTGEGLLAGPPARFGTVALPALACVAGDDPRTELREIR